MSTQTLTLQIPTLLAEELGTASKALFKQLEFGIEHSCPLQQNTISYLF